jgi:DNA gyrase subunit A
LQDTVESWFVQERKLMAKQLNLLSSGQVIPTALHAEMQQSYLEYAMSVIVGRALPDVRDGLKPVHRRILYAMHELGLTPDRPYRKCARVVGDVLGKYHPHGDQAVYDAMVRLIQDFSSRYPLLGGHGNFGSVDNDPPAAMRYTETRLAEIGNEALLDEIAESTVEFIGNFDNSQQEPTVLPAQLPILLLNGCSGIAVGMATNIPPHNLGEIVDGAIALIDRPTLSDDKLFELIPGPDFPTGGEIVETDGIRSAYTTGRGIIPVRGVTQIEEIQGGRGRHRRTAIVVTELPFQVNKAGWIEKVADLVNQSKLDGISDIRDESDREGIRVVIELKREADPHTVLYHLYHQTPLQNNFGVILLALVNGQPKQLPLREVLQEFLNFREQTLTRRYTHELEETENRLHLLEGLLAALNHLDEAIAILRNSPDGSTAKITFQEQLNLSAAQADAILAMPMRRITALERQKIEEEQAQLEAKRKELKRLLGDRHELLKELKKHLRALKRKYADPRRTRIISEREAAAATAKAKPRQSGKTRETSAGKGKADSGKTRKSSRSRATPATAELERPPEEAIVGFTQRGYVRRLSPGAIEPKENHRRKTATVEELAANEDFYIHSELTKTDRDILVFLTTGKAYSVKVGDIPPTTGRNAKGTPLITLLPPSAQGDPEAIAAHLLRSDEPTSTNLILLTQRGRIKRLSLSEFENLSARGLTACKLKNGDALERVVLARRHEQLAIATSGGRLLRLAIDDEHLPISTRTSQPQSALRLGKGEHLVGCVALRDRDHLILVSRQGYAKQLPLNLIRLAKPGDLGMQSMPFRSREDALAGIFSPPPDSDLIVLTDSDRLLSVPVRSIPVKGKDDPGDRLSKFKAKEEIVSLLSSASTI